MLEASSWFPNQHTPSINRSGGKWNRVWVWDYWDVWD